MRSFVIRRRSAAAAVAAVSCLITLSVDSLSSITSPPTMSRGQCVSSWSAIGVRKNPRCEAHLHASATATMAPLIVDAVNGRSRAGLIELAEPQKRRRQETRKVGNLVVDNIVPATKSKKKTAQLIRAPTKLQRDISGDRTVSVGTNAVKKKAAIWLNRQKRIHSPSSSNTSSSTSHAREEEAELVNRIRALRKVLEVREDYEALHGREPASEEEWAASVAPPLLLADLQRIVEEGHEARATLLSSNEGLVVQIAKRYQNPNLLGSALTPQDMIQEGKIGLLEAAERFEPERGFRFSTYASYWIKQKILRCISEHSRTIRLPAHVHAMLHTVIKARKEMTQEIGRVPSIPELAHRVSIPVEKLRSVLDSARHVISLELPFNHRGSNQKRDTRVLSDTIQSDMPTPEDQAEMDFLKRDIQAVMHEQLRDREREVLVLRFGLDDGTPKTIDEVAKRMSVSRDRVRIVEARALNKLRHPGRNYKLKEYVAGMMHEEKDQVAPSWMDERRWMF